MCNLCLSEYTGYLNVNFMVYQVSGIYLLFSGKQTHYQAVMLTLSANLIRLLYHNFGPSVKEKMNALVLSKRAVFPPKPTRIGIPKPTIPLNETLKKLAYQFKHCDDPNQLCKLANAQVRVAGAMHVINKKLERKHQNAIHHAEQHALNPSTQTE